MFKFYKVGGCVRDEFMGLKPKDIDDVVVSDQVNDKDKAVGLSAHSLFGALQQHLTSKGYTIFLSSPENYTVRAKIESGETVDFVMARKEIGYKEGTRQPIVVPGTLYDDLERRDFTVNAIAIDLENGEYIDPFNGRLDIRMMVLRTPLLKPSLTLNDDPLRILRAIRFHITKGFYIYSDLDYTIRQFDYDNKMSVVSDDRIREELLKCFKHNTKKTLEVLREYHQLTEYIFTKTNLWLKPTNEQ